MLNFAIPSIGNLHTDVHTIFHVKFYKRYQLNFEWLKNPFRRFYRSLLTQIVNLQRRLENLPFPTNIIITNWKILASWHNDGTRERIYSSNYIFCTQSKINLLEDLQRNTFPRNQIPSDWFQTFEKHRIAYERLKKDRTEFEEKRNKLILASVRQSLQIKSFAWSLLNIISLF